jgi:hypothetical protein
MTMKQASHVAQLERNGRDAKKARQVLGLLHEALQNMLAHRAIIWRELRAKSQASPHAS